MSLIYYVADTETTGLNASNQEIIELSIIRCTDRIQLTRSIKAEFPERASPEALRVTNKSKEDILKGMPKENAVELIHNFILEDGLTPAHRCLICHNEKFDRKFLHALWKKVGKKFPADLFLCTMEMTREYAKMKNMGKVKVNLKDSLAMLKIAGIQRYHASSVDCQNTFLLWQKLMEENVDYLSLIKKFPHIDEEEVPAFPEF